MFENKAKAALEALESKQLKERDEAQRAAETTRAAVEKLRRTAEANLSVSWASVKGGANGYLSYLRAEGRLDGE